MYIAQCNLRNKNIYDVNLYIYIYIYMCACARARACVCVIKTKHEIAKSLQAAGIFLSERYHMLKISLQQFSKKLFLHLYCYGGKNYMSR